ncbi:hypothetical protein ACFPYI_01795 [Halomarina salina]|uniref:Radical SAM protein n=1 Tax=Halomarina salina TaxID=1872699 RepID=A0ABD5RHL4_9EURY|nr:hypothetical protein [Halomarina salina]
MATLYGKTCQGGCGRRMLVGKGDRPVCPACLAAAPEEVEA